MTNNFTFQGKLTHCEKVKQFTNAQGRIIKARDLHFTDNAQFPQTFIGTIFGEKAEQTFQVGQNYIVKFNINIKTTQKGKFNNIKIWSINKIENFSN